MIVPPCKYGISNCGCQTDPRNRKTPEPLTTQCKYGGLATVGCWIVAACGCQTVYKPREVVMEEDEVEQEMIKGELSADYVVPHKHHLQFQGRVRWDLIFRCSGCRGVVRINQTIYKMYVAPAALNRRERFVIALANRG